MNLPVRMMLRLGTGAGLALALAACGPDDAQQSKLADVEWPFDRAGLDSGWPGGAGLPPLPEAEPMMLDAGGGYVDGYRDRGPSSITYASYRGGDTYNYGYAPAYFDDAYYDEPEDAYWVDDGPNGNSYALIALAAVLGGVFADAPPDYGFAYDGVQPWAWETGDRYRRYAEPIPGGWRTYWYAPEADYPFLVQDPYYSYGYRENRVAVIYDRGGRLIDPGRAWRQRRVADRYYDRGFDLYRASRIADRHGVAAPLWASRRTQFVDTQRDWERVRDRQWGWQQWDRRHDEVMTARWSQEKAVRHYAAGRFDDWRKRDFKGNAPRFYQEAGRDPQVRRTVLAQQASLYRQTRDQRQRGDASRGDWQNPGPRRDLALAGRPDGGERQRQSLMMQRGGSPREQAMQERAGRQSVEPAFQRDDRRQLALQQREARRAATMQGQREQAQQQRQQRMASQRQQMQDQRAGQMAERRQQMQQQRQAQASQQRQRQAEARQAQMAERRQQAQQQRQAQASQQRQQQAQARQAQMAERRQQAQQQRQAQASQQRQQQAQARQAQMAERRQQAQQQRQAQASQQRQQQAQARQAQMAERRQQAQQQRQAQASQQRQQQMQQQMQQRQAQQQARAQQRQQQAMAQGGSGGGQGGGRERGGGHGRDRP